MELYKIETFIPKEAFDKVFDALVDNGFGKIGDYDCCMNWYEVNSSWRPNKKANPYKGKVGNLEHTTEIKLEFRCDKNDLQTAISLIKNNHPYEEVCINVLPLIEV